MCSVKLPRVLLELKNLTCDERRHALSNCENKQVLMNDKLLINNTCSSSCLLFVGARLVSRHSTVRLISSFFY